MASFLESQTPLTISLVAQVSQLMIVIVKVPQKVASELHPKVRNHGEGPYSWSLNVKLGPRRNYHKGQAAIRHYANQTTRPL